MQCPLIANLQMHYSVTDGDQTSYPYVTGWLILSKAFLPRQRSSPVVGFMTIHVMNVGVYDTDLVATTI